MPKGKPPYLAIVLFASVLFLFGLGGALTILSGNVVYSDTSVLLLAPSNQTSSGLQISNDSGEIVLSPLGFVRIAIEGFPNVTEVSAWIQGNATGGDFVTPGQLSGNLTDYPTWSAYYDNATASFVDWGTLDGMPTLGDLAEYQPLSGMGEYSTGSQADSNYTTINATVSTKITWEQAMNGTLLTSVPGTYATGAQVTANLTGSYVSATQLSGNLSASAVSPSQLSGNLTTIPKTIGYDTQTNLSYFVIDGSSMTLTVASLQRITTAPTVNTTPTNGEPDAYNFPTAASVGGDGGFVLAGNTATNTATFTATKMTYFRMCGQMNLATNRRDMIGVFKTGTTVVMNSSLTGILFKANTTADGNLYALVCNAGTCTTSSSLGALNQNRNCYEITDNGATWNFWLNGVSVANLSNSNEPTTNVATAGWWTESTDATADNVVIDIASARLEGWR